MKVLIVEVVRASIHRFSDGHMLTIDFPKAMMVLPFVAVGVRDDHPIVRSGRSYDDLFMVGIHYGITDISYQHTDCVVCHSETILQTFGTVPCSHIAESDGHLQSWVQSLAVIRVELANQGCQPVHHLLKYCRFAPYKVLECGRIFNPQFHHKIAQTLVISATMVDTTIVAAASTCADKRLVDADAGLLQYSVDHLTELTPREVVLCELDP